VHQRIYLDYNATTPLDPRVLDAVVRQLQEEVGNPSSSHYHGQQSKNILESSRHTIADFLRVKTQEVIFTSGGTEGAFLLLHGIMEKYPTGHIITSDAEHSCVYQTVRQLVAKGYEATFLPTGLWGAVKPEDVKAAIRPDTRLITLLAVNNETGVKTDLEPIAAIAERAAIPLVVDGVALLGKEPIVWPTGVAAAFFSGHKIHAPKGIGFYFCRKNIKLIPMIVGGSQEFNRRAGTENLAGIVGLAEAIKILKQDQPQITREMLRLRLLLEEGLMRLGHVKVNGEGPLVSNTINLSFLEIDGETLLMNLDMEGLSVSHGSACTSGALEPSRILLNMGIPLAQARSAIRFSIGRNTTEAEIEQTIAIVTRVVTKLRAMKKRHG
jgi:cysteine desulfurase